MKSISLKQRLGLGLAVLMLVGGIAIGPIQALAAPTDSSSQFASVQAVQFQTNAAQPDKQKNKDKIIARIKQALDNVNKRIDVVKDKLSKATKQAAKAIRPLAGTQD